MTQTCWRSAIALLAGSSQARRAGLERAVINGVPVITRVHPPPHRALPVTHLSHEQRDTRVTHRHPGHSCSCLCAWGWGYRGFVCGLNDICTWIHLNCMGIPSIRMGTHVIRMGTHDIRMGIPIVHMEIDVICMGMDGICTRITHYPHGDNTLSAHTTCRQVGCPHPLCAATLQTFQAQMPCLYPASPWPP